MQMYNKLFIPYLQKMQEKDTNTDYNVSLLQTVHLA
jgi:hypothetical protein